MGNISVCVWIKRSQCVNQKQTNVSGSFHNNKIWIANPKQLRVKQYMIVLVFLARELSINK